MSPNEERSSLKEDEWSAPKTEICFLKSLSVKHVHEREGINVNSDNYSLKKKVTDVCLSLQSQPFLFIYS